MAIQRFRKRAVIVDAVRWTGENEHELLEFAGAHVSLPRVGGPEAGVARVFDALYHAWLEARVGDWIVRSGRGEFYPVAAEVLEAGYEPLLG